MFCPAYTGRISGKALALDSGYLNMLPPYSMVMADEGFNKRNKCAPKHLSPETWTVTNDSGIN